ncbi:ATP-binding protein [Kytococcus sp. Marseille-QA3725]
MRTATNCPFSPGSDTVPQIWAGRTTELSDWHDHLRPRRLAGVTERSRTVLGEAGLGKSVLVRRIAQEAEQEGAWVTRQLRIPRGADPIKLLATALLELADKAHLATSRERRIKDLLGRVDQIAVAGWSLTLRDSPGLDPHVALTQLLIEVGRAARERKDTMVLIHLDEIQNVTDDDVLSQLLIALGDALSHTERITVPGGGMLDVFLPIAVYLTGLPDFEDKAAARTGATFARRFGTTILTPISDDDLRLALSEFIEDGWLVTDAQGNPGRVHMTAAAREALIACCCGEPFLFQLAGSRAWSAGTGATITLDDIERGWETAKSEAISHVERILDRLPAREREFVDAMAALPAGERQLTVIANAMGLSKGSAAGPTSQRLDRVRGIIQRGKPYSFRHRAVEAYLTSDWPDVDLDPQTGKDRTRVSR